jgi:hypothetical protein
MTEVAELFDSNPEDIRLLLGVARVFLTASRYDLDLSKGETCRVGRKRTVEECLSIDAGDWGNLPATGRWCWRNGSTSGYTFDPNRRRLRLFYTIFRNWENSASQEESVDYYTQLTTTRPRFGGVRWWFVCPLTVNDMGCNRLVSRLYLPPRSRYFGCRHCHRLTYASRQVGRKGC